MFRQEFIVKLAEGTVLLDQSHLRLPAGCSFLVIGVYALNDVKAAVRSLNYRTDLSLFQRKCGLFHRSVRFAPSQTEANLILYTVLSGVGGLICCFL